MSDYGKLLPQPTADTQPYWDGLKAHRLRVERGDYNIAPIHLADAIEQLVTASRESLSQDRAPKDPYARSRPEGVEVPDAQGG